MKTLPLAIIGVAFILASCSSTKKAASSEYDDVYYNPNQAATQEADLAAVGTATVSPQEVMETQPLYQSAETVVAELLPVRMGYNTRNDAGPGIAVGIGWLWQGDRMDYAFEPFGELGSAHRLSITWKWGKAGPRGPAGTPGL